MKNRNLLLVVGAIVLQGCGGGGGSSAPTTSDANGGTAVRSGFAVDDYIIGGQVNIYSAQTGSLLEQTVTSDVGTFNWSNKVTGVVRIEVSGGVEDIDGLSSTTNDQKPFARKLTTLINATTNSAPVVMSALTTGIETYANGDIAKFNSAVDALDANLRRLIVTSDIAGDAAQQTIRLETLKTLTSSIGFDSVATELADDGQLNKSVSVSSDAAVSVAIASTTQSDIKALRDTGLRTCVADTLEKDVADVTLADLGEITSLNCNDHGVYSVTGVSTLGKLQSFVCTNCEISDISEFANMPSIQALSIRNNRVKSIAPLISAQFASLEFDIADNCVTDIALLGGTTKINVTGYGNPNHQYSTCYKNDADVYVFRPYVTTTGAYTLLYRTSYNSASICSIDWGDGATSQAYCNNTPRRVTHTYSSPPTNPVKFLINGVVKKSGAFPLSGQDAFMQSFAIQQLQLGSTSTTTYSAALGIYISSSVTGAYDNATVRGLGTETQPNGVAKLADNGNARLAVVQILDGIETIVGGELFPLPETMTPGYIPAGTAYVVKLYKGTTLVSTQSITLPAAAIVPSEMTSTMFPRLTLTSYAELCPNDLPTTALWNELPSNTDLSNRVERYIYCSNQGPSMTWANGSVSVSDSLNRRFMTTFLVRAP